MNFTIKEFCRRVTKETQNSTLTFEDSKMVADSLRSLHNNYLDDDFRKLFYIFIIVYYLFINNFNILI